MKKLGFGMMRLPLLDKDDPRSIDEETVKKMIDTFLSRGFTYVDTAYMYHDYQSERAVKTCLVDRYARDAFVLADKLPVIFLKKKEDVERIFEEQLSKCGVSYFDYYLLHNLNSHTIETCETYDCFSFLSGLKAQGLAKHIGFSFHDSPALLEEILSRHPDVDFVQLQINYLDWENPAIASRACYEICRIYHKPVTVMEPVKGGTLAELPPQALDVFAAIDPALSPACWALKFAAQLDGVDMVLSGMSSFAQLSANTAFMQQTPVMSPREESAYQSVVDILHASIPIGCTGCAYCEEACVKHIPIPRYFALYNADSQALNKDFSIQSAYYNNYAKRFAKASACLHCGKCTKHCPQHLDIPRWLEAVAERFETAEQ